MLFGCTEVDAQIAVRLFGWTWRMVQACERVVQWGAAVCGENVTDKYDRRIGWDDFLPKYSTSSHACRAVENKLKQLFPDAEISARKAVDTWVAELKLLDEKWGQKTWQGFGKTREMAICMLALNSQLEIKAT